MKTSSQKITQKKKIKRHFIERFKAEVRDSNSYENLRISKIDESSYKIYNTNHKISANQNTATKRVQSNEFFFSHDPYSQLNQLQTAERKVMCSDYFLNQNQQIQQVKGCSKYLEQLLKSRLEDFYKMIKTRVNQVQNSLVLTQQKKIEAYKVQELISIVDSIYQSTSKLRSLGSFDIQSHNINIILKSLIDKAKNYDKSNQIQSNHFIQRYDRTKNDVDQVMPGLARQILSFSSFKIQNQNIHQQQFFNACLSNHNSKPDLHYNRVDSFIKQECQEHQRQISKQQSLSTKFYTQAITSNPSKSDSKQITKKLKPKPKSSSKQTESKAVCQLLQCSQTQKQNYNTDSESKRRVLNDVIVMLNNKFNRYVKQQ